MILPNCPEYVIAFFACQRIGAVAVGNNPLYTERELEHQIKDSGATVMIVLDQIYHRFGEVRDAARRAARSSPSSSTTTWRRPSSGSRR